MRKIGVEGRRCIGQLKTKIWKSYGSYWPRTRMLGRRINLATYSLHTALQWQLVMKALGLLDANMDVTAQDKKGKTLLHLAAINENLQVVTVLLNGPM